MEVKRFWILVLFVGAVNTSVRAQQVADYYSPITEWQQASGGKVTPIHIALLPDGDLFFMAPDFVMSPAPAYELPPPTITIEPLLSAFPPPFIDETTGLVNETTLVCAGHTLDSEGKLFAAGGTTLKYEPAAVLPEEAKGIPDAVSFDPLTQTWSHHADMIGSASAVDDARRWYPTVTRLADSRLLVTGGWDKLEPEQTPINSVEVYDPTTNAWSVVSDYDAAPAGIAHPDYPHVFQMPFDYTSLEDGTKYDVVQMMGGSGEPLWLFMNGTEHHWYRTGNYRPGAKEIVDEFYPSTVYPNGGASSVLLPLRLFDDGWGYANGSVLMVGGTHFSVMEGSVDVYDPIADSWRPSISLGMLRHHPSTVLLPDGRMLILAGHDNEAAVSLTGHAQYIDPKNDFALSQGLASMPEVRGYHTVSVLLPDGRVILGGGNPGGGYGNEREDFRYYYPDYMFQDRPVIYYAQPVINVDRYFPIAVPHLTSVDEIALMSLGSMTHSFDMSQRHVQLRLHSETVLLKIIDGEATEADAASCAAVPAECLDLYYVQAPPSLELASSGHYMLFVLDDQRVPSIAKIVKLEN
ncbi:MAG: galactose oxidase [Gammaproteobacteria bacterium]|jgi:galactose oxidase